MKRMTEPRYESAKVGQDPPYRAGLDERVSVIMPCYNAAAYVGEAIEDVLAQTYGPVELIVVDDGSTDGSADVVARYGRAVRLIRQSNGGCASARNTGLAHATGAYVAFLDADDRWDPRILEALVGALADHGADVPSERADLAYCGWARFWGHLGTARPFIPHDLEADHADKLEFVMQCCPFPIHAVLVRMARLREVGGFDPRFPPAEDYDLWLRLAARCRFVRVPQVMAYYRRHPGQQTTDLFAQTLQRWCVLQEFVRTNRQRVRHIPRDTLSDWVNGLFRREGYDAYWRRDLPTARSCFRRMARIGQVRLTDLRVLLPSLLPLRLHEHLLLWRDALRRGENIPAVIA